MKSPEINFQTAIEAFDQHLVWLVELELDSDTFRFTSADIDLWVAGNRFMARGMEVAPIRYQLALTADKGTVTLDNTDNAIGAIIRGEEVRGRVATVYQAAVLGPGSLVAEPFFIGIIDSVPECNRGRAKLGIYGWLITSRRKVPRRKHSHLCEVPAFKDDYCGYGGAATFCNRSYRRCKDLGNEANFHGHRFLPAMMKKKLYWGRGAPK